jgi:hypothetical protein
MDLLIAFEDLSYTREVFEELRFERSDMVIDAKSQVEVLKTYRIEFPILNERLAYVRN